MSKTKTWGILNRLKRFSKYLRVNVEIPCKYSGVRRGRGVRLRGAVFFCCHADVTGRRWRCPHPLRPPDTRGRGVYSHRDSLKQVWSFLSPQGRLSRSAVIFGSVEKPKQSFPCENPISTWAGLSWLLERASHPYFSLGNEIKEVQIADA